MTAEKARPRSKGRKVLKVILIILLILAAFAAAVLITYTIAEYRPAARESMVPPQGNRTVSAGGSLSLVTYNVGYCGLGAAEDFFMDGGTHSFPDTKEAVESYIEGNQKLMADLSADLYLLQEVDLDSRRSYYTDQRASFEQALGMNSMYACNYRCFWVPFPIPMLGKVEGGLVTLTNYNIDAVDRLALPESFSWPIKTCNLKRCLLVSRMPVEGSSHELVIINLHLEAYDSGEGKIAQTKVLNEILEQEYAKGNYVIAGGDFNQTFEGIRTIPVQDESYWQPGKYALADLPEHYAFAVSDDDSTTRLDNKPYDAATQQEYIIDGFIVSDNITVNSVNVVPTEYEYSDHRPVRLEITLND